MDTYASLFLALAISLSLSLALSLSLSLSLSLYIYIYISYSKFTYYGEIGNTLRNTSEAGLETWTCSFQPTAYLGHGHKNYSSSGVRTYWGVDFRG